MTNFFKWLSSAFFVLAGVMIALKINLEYVYISYILFALGHAITIIVFSKQKEFSIVLPAIFFLTIDIIGIIRWI